MLEESYCQLRKTKQPLYLTKEFDEAFNKELNLKRIIDISLSIVKSVDTEFPTIRNLMCVCVIILEKY